MRQENPFDYKTDRYRYEIYEYLSEHFKGKVFAGEKETILFNPTPKLDIQDPQRRTPVVEVDVLPENYEARCKVFLPTNSEPRLYNVVPLGSSGSLNPLKDAEKIADYFIVIVMQVQDGMDVAAAN